VAGGFGGVLLAAVELPAEVWPLAAQLALEVLLPPEPLLPP
jgi:hypothetical protein